MVLDLTVITNKYQFTSYQGWAMDLLLGHCSKGTEALQTDLISRIVEVAAICGRPDLIRLVMGVWLARVESGMDSLDRMLEICERHHIGFALIQVYMFQIQKMVALKPSATGALPLKSLQLKGCHLIRVLAGFASLVAHRERDIDIVMSTPDLCDGHGTCRSALLYTSMIYGKKEESHNIDPIVRYTHLIQTLVDYIPLPGYSEEYQWDDTCRLKIVAHYTRLHDEAVDSLPNYFFTLEEGW